MVVSGGATPFMTNSKRPKGGVVKPISSRISISTPNQTRSMPASWARGMKNGSVIIIMLTWSMKQPRNKRISSIDTTSMVGCSSSALTSLSSPSVAPEKDRICEKVIDAQIMKRIMTEILAVSTSAFLRLAQLSDR